MAGIASAPVIGAPGRRARWPETMKHPALKLDLSAILRAYQAEYPGAMYSGCGGGYLFVASDDPVPGAFHVNIRTQAR